jgi:hypothetical protein
MHASEFARKRAKIERRAKGRTQFARKAMEHLQREAQATQIIVKGRVVAWLMKDGGVVCAKERYHDAIQAQLELVRIARFARNSYVPVRAYPCPYCHGFHLTSRGKTLAANDNNRAE